MRIRPFFSKALALAAIPALAIGMSGCAKDNDKGGSDEKDTKKEENKDAKDGEKKEGEEKDDKGGEAKKLNIVTTTGYLGDAVKNIAPEADVFVIVKPGGDPHTHQPTTDEIEKMKAADLTISSGLHLEPLMHDALSALGDKHLSAGDKALQEGDLLPWPEKDEKGNDLHDPHIWNSPTNWQKVVTTVADRIAEVDSANADTYKKNAEEFNKKIEELNTEAKAKFDAIPKEKRILITGHDAFNYLGKTYDLEVQATDFVTTEATKSAAQIDELAQTIVDKKVKTIFVDNTANPQAIKSLQEKVKAKGGDVAVSDKELYADTLGDAAPVDTYLGVFKHNADAITEALAK